MARKNLKVVVASGAKQSRFHKHTYGIASHTLRNDMWWIFYDFITLDSANKYR